MTAAAYIAKYVTKNIDWDRLEKDFEGNDSLETSACVEAWASRWRIRQFQQIDGSPVTARATPCGSCTGRRAGFCGQSPQRSQSRRGIRGMRKRLRGVGSLRESAGQSERLASRSRADREGSKRRARLLRRDVRSADNRYRISGDVPRSRRDPQLQPFPFGHG